MSAAHFQPLNVPISGTHLIEASAGTGKTWNIAALYTRLVAEEKLPVEKILVVTFTKAATAELKTRLRARLDEALSALRAAEEAAGQGGGFDQALAQACAADTGFLLPLLRRALAGEEGDEEQRRARLRLRLQAAVSDFDGAAVYTIHGFCQRVLQDFAFYCRVPFALALDEEGGGEEQAAAAGDFWRGRVAADPLLAEMAYRSGADPEAQRRELAPFLARPYLRLREAAGARLPSLIRELEEEWRRVVPLLPAAEAAFWQIFPGLKGNYFKEDAYRRRFDVLNRLSGSLKPDAAELLEALRHQPKDAGPYCPFAAANLLDKLKKGSPPPASETLAAADVFGRLYDLADQVVRAGEEALVAAGQEMLSFLRRAREQAKRRSPARGYDDLLLDVFDALQESAPHAQALAAAMAAQWQVALIDEFQDTDPLQYAVFSRAFGSGSDSRALFLVGDPKQAIYRFRGADIFAYLQAAEDAGGRHSLAHNHRSHAQLLAGINALFARPLPFVLDKIAYPPVSAPRGRSRLLPPRPALTVRWLDAEEGAGGSTAAALERCAADWCADEIAALLNGAAAGTQKLAAEDGGTRPLPAEGIAVLVRTHREGTLVQRALMRRGVPGVLLSRDSVFAGEEAQSLLALMRFITEPRHTAPLVFALSGSLYRRSAAELAALKNDAAALEQWRLLAASALETWRRYGAYAALQQFLSAEGAEAGLLARRDWRALTNLHQLLELLAGQDTRLGSPEALRQWFARELAAAAAGVSRSGAELRLESDEHLVKIVTMHAAKGLQYPIVFCPFVWRGGTAGQRENWTVLHRPGGRTELVHRSQMDDQDSAAASEEALSEDLRLLYVAFTRAEEQLNLYAGWTKNGGRGGALPYLLQMPECKDAACCRAAWQDWIAAQDPQTGIAWLEGAPEPAQFSGSGTARPHFRAVELRRRHFARQGQTSFTALVRRHEAARGGHGEDTLLPALDAAEQSFRQPETDGEAEGEGLGALSGFARGAAAGVCLHEVMEGLDFGRPAADQRDQVGLTLQKHGFDAAVWTDAVCEGAEAVRRLPLAPGISFASLPENSRISEMGFLFAVEDFSPAAVSAWLAQPHLGLPAAVLAAAARLDFQDVAGLVSGFIDETVYTGGGEVYVADYKSNYLGGRREDYRREALDEAMAEHHYYLQALIYAVAAVRYLRSRGRQPETVCVRYLFLRGLDGTDNGIWSWDIAVKDLEGWVS